MRYHAVVNESRRAFAIGAALFACLTATVAPARAEGVLPPNADVRVGAKTDADTFTRAIATRYHVTLRRVVATDIDRDGDVDFVAATDAGLLVWVNDGAGHLTPQAPQHLPAVNGVPPPTAWHGDESSRDLPVQNDLPSSHAQDAGAHAPPPVAPSPIARGHLRRPLGGALSTRVPRAPPR